MSSVKNFEPQKMKGITFTGIRRVLERANALAAEGKYIVHFEIGQPDFVTPKYIRDAACASLQKGNTRYTSNYGTLPLRKAIAAKLKAENGIDADPQSEIIVTVGGEEAVSAVVAALTDAGDEVILSDPGYSPYDSIVKIVNAVPVYVPLLEEKNWSYDLDALERSITGRTKLLLLCTPSNPTGTLMDRDSLLKLSEICVRHNIIVVADEAYERILYDGSVHTSIASLPGMWERTVTIQSFSKSYSMCGFRIGYLAAPAELASIIMRVHQKLVLCASATSQDAALAALTEKSDETAAMLAEFDRRRKYICAALDEMGIPCARPQGAFYVFPNVSTLGMDGDVFCREFLERFGVACVPGSDFGPNARNNIRLSYAASFEDCVEGMKRLKQFAAEVRGQRN